MKWTPTKSLWAIIVIFVLNGIFNIYSASRYSGNYKILYIVTGILGITTGLGLLLKKRPFRILSLGIVILPLLSMPLIAGGFFSELHFASVCMCMIFVPLLYWEFSVLRDVNKMYKSNQRVDPTSADAQSIVPED